MDDIEELTTAEIAQRVGKTERTVQRWIQSEKLPVLQLAGNRYAVKSKDLKRLTRPVHVTSHEADLLELERVLSDQSLQAKYDDLKYEVEDLRLRLYQAEQVIERLNYRLDQVIRQQREQKRPAARRKKKRLKRGEISLDSLLPLDLTGLSAFTEQHGIPQHLVRKAIEGSQLFVERGNWRDGYRTVKVAIDERGCAIFYELFNQHPKFQQCEECPHSWW